MMPKSNIALSENERIVLKNTQLELLDEVKCFCDENSLTFYLMGGTLLGAIRHKGYIPWDDDIDVCMPREDYDRFLNLYKENSVFFLQSTGTDRHYFYHFSKLMKKGTTYNESFTQNIKSRKGIFIDIFPINGYPDKKIAEFHYKFWLFIFNKKAYPLNVVKDRKIKRDASYVLMTIVSWLFLWWTPYHLCAKMRNSFMKRHQYAKSKKCFVGADLRKIYDKDVFAGKSEVIFEKRAMYAMNDPCLYLSKTYGDYLKLPPENERVPHHYLVEFKG